MRTEAKREYRRTYMRKWRKTHPLVGVARLKDTVRSYAGVYLRRGKIVRQACLKCAQLKAEMHHPDYSRPLAVVWLCRPCHLAEHGHADP